MDIKNVSRPTLILDESRCKRNIRRMVKKAEKNQCQFRPHFKTHQSRTVGKWFKDEGIQGITVSSPDMALYFAEDGWDDITIAFPFYPTQLNKLKKLEKLCSLRLFIDSEEDLNLLKDHLNNPFMAVIEIDGGFGRSGIHFQNTDLINDLIKLSNRLDLSTFHGFYIHDGRTYQVKGKHEVERAISPSLDALKGLKKKFPDSKISLGDTPSASLLDDISDLDEITPGNMVFYDWMQVNIGSCTLDEVSMFVALPIAQVDKNRTDAIVHGGAAHLSKDYILSNGQKNYGQLVDYASGSNIKAVENSFLSALSQEHGTLNYLPDWITNHVTICPIHSCLTANLFDHYVTTDGNRIDKRILS